MKKRKYKYLLLVLLIICIFINNISKRINVQKERENINNYYDTNYNKNKYIAILNIPKINLEKGVYSINNKHNNIRENITILKESKMPDNENSILFLAAHSGNSKISFFNNLEQLEINDLININYNHNKYIYKIIDIYLELKKGTITIPKLINNKYLVLTTCSQEKKGYQLIIIAQLIYG